jgi:hypothetical protein
MGAAEACVNLNDSRNQLMKDVTKLTHSKVTKDKLSISSGWRSKTPLVGLRYIATPLVTSKATRHIQGTNTLTGRRSKADASTGKREIRGTALLGSRCTRPG